MSSGETLGIGDIQCVLRGEAQDCEWSAVIALQRRCPGDGDACGALEARREPRLMPFVETWLTRSGHAPAPCAAEAWPHTLQNGARRTSTARHAPGKAFHDGNGLDRKACQ